jgi:hypothetical protein
MMVSGADPAAREALVAQPGALGVRTRAREGPFRRDNGAW